MQNFCTDKKFERNFRALKSVIRRIFRFAEQCHDQAFDIICILFFFSPSRGAGFILKFACYCEGFMPIGSLFGAP